MINFKSFLTEEVIVLSDDDLNEMLDNTEWEDIIDLYEDDELELDEAISAGSRMKKGQKFRSIKGKVVTARQIKLRRASDTKTITKRARSAARRAVMNRLLKGKDKSTLSAAEKDRLEAMVRRILSMQGNVEARFIPKVKDIERKRLSGKNK